MLKKMWWIFFTSEMLLYELRTGLYEPRLEFFIAAGFLGWVHSFFLEKIDEHQKIIHNDTLKCHQIYYLIIKSKT
jgi:hypothetical protein